MNNNNIILQIHQFNRQNKNPNSIINNTYPKINWRYHWFLKKLIRAISWIKKLKSNWIKWKTGGKQRRTSTYYWWQNFKILNST